MRPGSFVTLHLTPDKSSGSSHNQINTGKAMFTARTAEILHVRTTQALRGVGILLIAFSPLDTAISGTRFQVLAGFLAVGLFLFAAALAMELWRQP
jgi:hypothetical protein